MQIPANWLAYHMGLKWDPQAFLASEQSAGFPTGKITMAATDADGLITMVALMLLDV